ncbi:MAG: hypothetical protein ACYDHY_14910 [Acidiferrobacterales bacterium]
MRPDQKIPEAGRKYLDAILLTEDWAATEVKLSCCAKSIEFAIERIAQAVLQHPGTRKNLPRSTTARLLGQLPIVFPMPATQREPSARAPPKAQASGGGMRLKRRASMTKRKQGAEARAGAQSDIKVVVSFQGGW